MNSNFCIFATIEWIKCIQLFWIKDFFLNLRVHIFRLVQHACFYLLIKLNNLHFQFNIICFTQTFLVCQAHENIFRWRLLQFSRICVSELPRWYDSGQDGGCQTKSPLHAHNPLWHSRLLKMSSFSISPRKCHELTSSDPVP